MLKPYVEKLGIIYSSLLTTGISTIISVCITASIMIWLKIPYPIFTNVIIIAIICPLVIASPLSYFWFKLFERSNNDRLKLEILNQRLEQTLKEVKELSGLLPICASCKKIRDDKGYWNQLESYIKIHSKADFSHSICPECANKLYSEFLPKKE